MQRAPFRLVGRTAVSLARHSSLSVSLFRFAFVPGPLALFFAHCFKNIN